MSDLINPYITDNPVGDHTTFIERTDILRDVMLILRHDKQNAMVLYGQRCIGKTSVLQHLKTYLPTQGDYYPIYFDLQDKAHLTLAQVVNELAKSIANTLNYAEPDLGEQPEAMFQDSWLPDILQNLSENAALVLLFDEFDVFDEPKAELAGVRFYPYIRQLLDYNPRHLNFIFTGGRSIDDLDPMAISLFIGIPPIKRLSLLNQADTTKLVRFSEGNNSLIWPNEAIECVWQYTHGHPFLTQQVCYQVWAQAYESGKTSEKMPTATPADVENVIFDVLDASRNRMAWLWEGLPPAERVVAAAMAEAGGKVMTEKALEKKLYESGVRVVIRELQNAPHLLQDWDLLALTEAGYQFQVELIRRWIRENKPLQRIQVELDRIDPVAEKIFQAAGVLHKENQLELSAQQLREAIALNPNHLGAHQLLADILLAQGQAEEAKILLEKLYYYQPLTARSRLIQALLALAQKTENEAQQLELYEQVLSLEPHQVEATAKSRKLWQQRGETALAKADFKAALAIYKKLGINKKIAEIEQTILDQYFDLTQKPSIFKTRIHYPLWVLVILLLVFGVLFVLGIQPVERSAIPLLEPHTSLEPNISVEQALEQAHQKLAYKAGRLEHIQEQNTVLKETLEQNDEKQEELEKQLEHTQGQKTSLAKTLEQVSGKNTVLEQTLTQAQQKVVQLETALKEVSPTTELGRLMSQLKTGDQVVIVGSYARRKDAERQLEKLKTKYPELFSSQVDALDFTETNIYKAGNVWEIAISGSYSYQSAKILEKKLLEPELVEDIFIKRKPK